MPCGQPPLPVGSRRPSPPVHVGAPAQCTERGAPSGPLGRAVVFTGEAWAEEPDAWADLQEQAQRGRLLHRGESAEEEAVACLLYTSDAADDM
eukprot:5359674-Alexandrium_andersonii.AAC.1